MKYQHGIYACRLLITKNLHLWHTHTGDWRKYFMFGKRKAYRGEKWVFYISALSLVMDDREELDNIKRRLQKER